MLGRREETSVLWGSFLKGELTQARPAELASEFGSFVCLFNNQVFVELFLCVLFRVTGERVQAVLITQSYRPAGEVDSRLPHSSMLCDRAQDQEAGVMSSV